MRGLCGLALCALCMWTCCVQGALQSKPRYKTENATVVSNKWILMEEKIQGLVESTLKRALPALTRGEANISAVCTESLLQLVFALKDSKLWAFQMLDSWGKPSGGQLVGTASAYGAFDECMDLSIPGNDPSRSMITKGKYCLLDFRPALPEKPQLSSQYLPLPEPLDSLKTKLEIVEELKRQSWAFYQAAFRLGGCLPSTCSTEDIQKLASLGADYIGFSADVHSCQINEGKKFEVEHLFIIAFLSVFVCLTVLSSVLDAYFDECCGTPENVKPSTFRRLVQAFSVQRNLRNTLRTSSESGSPVSCLHGIRFLSMVWVILSHTYLVLDPALYRYGKNLGEIGKEIAFQPIVNSSLGVETFIFITGVLMAYQLVYQVDKRGRKIFNVPLLIFHRVWRLLPSAMLAVAFTILLPVLGSGPVWEEETQVPANNCRRNWWMILIFSNNFGPFNEMCLFHTWYISVDMQLMILGIFFFIFLFWKPVCAVILNVFYIVICIAGSTAITWMMGLSPTFIMAAPDKEATALVAQFTYFLPINQLGIYCLGLGLGTILARKKDIQIPKILQVVGWILAVVINLSICYGVVVWNRGNMPGRLESILYAGLHRTAWGIGLAWITLMCATGKAGLINSFLSWSGFAPFNRLTFLVYLFHILVITYFLGSLRGVIDVAHPMIVWIFFGNLTITFALALVLRLLYEAPLGEVERLICEHLMRMSEDKNKVIKKEEDMEGQDNGATADVSRL